MIVSFCGTKPQVGKTTCSNIFSEITGASIVEFSTPISIMANFLYGYNGNKSILSQRRKLQELGLSSKTVDPDYWCWRVLFLIEKKNVVFNDFSYDNIEKFKKNVLKNGLKFKKKNRNIIISGVRSPAEADFLKKFGSEIYLVTRTNHLEDKEWVKHDVENQLVGYNGFDQEILNNGTKEELRLKVYDLIDLLRKQKKIMR